MRQRCRNPNTVGYKHYGGRGIALHPAWDKFEVFLADMGERPEGTSLDRIDANGNYKPPELPMGDPIRSRTRTGEGFTGRQPVLSAHTTPN